MPTDYYTFVKDIRPNGNGSPVSYKAISTLTDLTQGELVGWDADDNALKRYVRDGAGNIKLVGISRDSQAGLAKLGNQSALADAVDDVSVWTSGVHSLLGTAAETYTHGTAVYMSGTDTQKITNVAGGGVQIGTVHLPDGSTKTGAVRVPVLIDEYTKTQE